MDVSGDGECDCAVGVVPLKVHSAELLARPIGGDCIFGLEVADEVFYVGLVFVFDSEVIYDEAEGDGFGFVSEEPWCVL